jgi:polysaccharide deacetylase 2 family uncharacterized protein YibQ
MGRRGEVIRDPEGWPRQAKRNEPQAVRDPVNEPLGRTPEARPRRTARVVAVVGLLVLAVGAVALARTVDWRRSGEPFAVARIQSSPVGPAAAPAAATAKADPAQATANADQIEADSGVKVVRGGGGGAGASMIIDVPQALSLRLAPAPDRRLTEKSRFGLLPRVGADGARPADVYARPVLASAKLKPGAPRVALLVGGLGLNPASTADAIARLPAAVSLGFAPYGDGLEGEAAAAREAGHEVLLQSPMEPFTYPSDNPGPHTLLTGASDADNLESLRWQMGRFVGYAGIVNHLGGKFTADVRALTPALSEVAARGLFYLDDGSSPRSLAREIAPTLGLASAAADAVVDADAAPAAIDAALTRLETLARARGAAIGVATALPSSLDRIARWSAGLEARGIDLVPVSALTARAPGPAAAASR